MHLKIIQDSEINHYPFNIGITLSMASCSFSLFVLYICLATFDSVPRANSSKSAWHFFRVERIKGLSWGMRLAIDHQTDQLLILHRN